MTLLVIAATLALLGLYLLIKGLIRLLQRHPLKATAICTCGALSTTLGALLLAFSMNIASYQALTKERKVADLHFSQIAPQRFRASLQLVDGSTHQFELAGDEWQLDAKVLKWRGYANLLGLQSHYKLDRLSGRYSDIKQANQSTRTAHALSKEPGLDLWQSARTLPFADYLVDAYYGNAAYLPMSNDASYSIHISQTGLIARPTNAGAKNKVFRW